MRRFFMIMTALFTTVPCLVACDDGASDGATDGGSGAGGQGGAGGAGGAGGDLPPGVEVVDFDTGLPDALSLAALGEAGILTACEAVGAYESRFADALQPLRCLSFGVDTALVGAQDPDTCRRLNSLCLTVPYAADALARNCVDDFGRLPDWCKPSTVGEFEACIARNVGIERAAAANAALTCEQGIARGGVLPEGLWHCACNVPEIYGPPPPNDADRDGVLDADDRCPETGPHAEVSAVGCSALEDWDGDDVPNDADRCPDSVGPVSVHGCDLTQDPDQDGVLPPLEICPGTAPGAEVSRRGCSLDQDGDQDDFPDVSDPCPGSNLDLGVNGAGCDREQDLDDDGVPNDRDLCPGSTPGLNPTGCDRSQDVDLDGVPNEIDRCPDTFAIISNAEVNADGCSRQQDRDFDGVGNAQDRCADTPEGVAVEPSGCSAAQDVDFDGVGNLADVCPDTPANEGVDAAGCTPWQYDLLGFPVADLPDDARPFVYEAPGQPPITLYASEQVITDTEDRAEVRGALYLGLPDGGFLPMARADVALPYAIDSDGITGIGGQVDLALPGLDLLPGVRINEPVRGSVRFDTGARLLAAGVNAPLDPARAYLALDVRADFSAEVGQIQLSTGVEAGVTVVIDPFDPGFFGRFEASNIPFFERLREVALGASASGRLPFEPFEDGAFRPGVAPIPAFDGHLFLEGRFALGGFIPIPGIVIDATGQAVVDLEPYDDGRSALVGGPVRVGVNGEIEVGIDILGELRLTVPVARGTVSYGEPSLRERVVVAGSIGVDELRLPVRIPFRPVAALNARIEAGRSIEDLQVFFGGSLMFLATSIPGLSLFLDVQDVVVDGIVRLSVDGVFIDGTTNRSPIDAVEFLGPVNVSAWFPLHGDWEIRLDGRMVFEGREVRSVVVGSDQISVD